MLLPAVSRKELVYCLGLYWEMIPVLGLDPRNGIACGIPGHVLRDQPLSLPSWSQGPAPQRGTRLEYPIQTHRDSSNLDWNGFLCPRSKAVLPTVTIGTWALYLEPLPSSGLDIWCQVPGAKLDLVQQTYVVKKISEMYYALWLFETDFCSVAQACPKSSKLPASAS